LDQTRVKRILVADDADTITSLLVTALETNGYEVHTASDGVEAYEAGSSDDFDLVILDQLMPGLLGLEIIEKWRSEGISVPVIMLSGIDDDQTVVDSFDVGALDFIKKPFRLAELLARVRSRISAG
jgi:DNA-binding response OmpR family regulator